MRKVIAVLTALGMGLSGCATTGGLLTGGITLTPAQIAQLSCLILADGTTIAASFVAGGAGATVGKIANAIVTPCSQASQIAAIVTTPAQAQAAAAAAAQGASPVAAIQAKAKAGK